MEQKPLSRHQIYYLKNRERIIERERSRRAKNPDAHNAKCLASKRRNWGAYLAKNSEGNRRHRAELKAAAISALGGKCASCGYNADIRALQIDHIASDGAVERRASSNQWALYRSVAERGAQGKYQCLCANCNQIKRAEAGEHPPGRKRQFL